MTRAMKRENKGSSFDGWLQEDGIYEEVSAATIKRVLAQQREQPAEEKRLTKNQCNDVLMPKPGPAGRRTFR